MRAQHVPSYHLIQVPWSPGGDPRMSVAPDQGYILNTLAESISSPLQDFDIISVVQAKIFDFITYIP